MKKESTTILEREDLVEGSSKKTMNQIMFDDFKCSADLFHKSPIVLFIDDDGSTRILKNRFGNKGNKVLFV